MPEFSLKIIVYAKFTEEQEILTNLIQTTFDNFSSYLTSENFKKFPKINTNITFLSNDDDLQNSSSNDLIEKFKENNSNDLLLIGVFKHLLKDLNSNSPKTSLLQEKMYLFVNYESKDLLLMDKKNIPLIITNEFLNYLFYSAEKQLETHNGPCMRNMNNLSSINPSEPIFSSNYSLEELKFCPTCSERIIASTEKLDLVPSKVIRDTSTQDMKNKNSLEVETTKDETVPNNLIQRATRPPPRRTKELFDPNAELSFAQRKQINAILKNLSLLKEPLDDSEYLEVRKRFFDGKISEQVFLQILKRKSK